MHVAEVQTAVKQIVDMLSRCPNKVLVYHVDTREDVTAIESQLSPGFIRRVEWRFRRVQARS